MVHHPRIACCSQSLREVGVGDDAPERVGERLWITRGHNQTGDAVGDRVGRSPTAVTTTGRRIVIARCSTPLW